MPRHRSRSRPSAFSQPGWAAARPGRCRPSGSARCARPPELDAHRSRRWRRPTPPPRTARSSRPRGSVRSRRTSPSTSRCSRHQSSDAVPTIETWPPSWWGGRSSAKDPHLGAQVLAQRPVELGSPTSQEPRGPTTYAAVRRRRAGTRRSRRTDGSAESPCRDRSGPRRPRRRTSGRPEASRVQVDGVEGLPGHRLDRVAADLGDVHRSASPGTSRAGRRTTRRAAGRPRARCRSISNPSDSHRRTAAVLVDTTALNWIASKPGSGASRRRTPPSAGRSPDRALPADHERRGADMGTLGRAVRAHLRAAEQRRPRPRRRRRAARTRTTGSPPGTAARPSRRSRRPRRPRRRGRGPAASRRPSSDRAGISARSSWGPRW